MSKNFFNSQQSEESFETHLDEIQSCNQCPKAFSENRTFEETYENTHM